MLIFLSKMYLISTDVANDDVSECKNRGLADALSPGCPHRVGFGYGLLG